MTILAINRNPAPVPALVSVTRPQLAYRLQRLAKQGETRTETVESPYGLIVEVSCNLAHPFVKSGICSSKRAYSRGGVVLFFTYRIVG